MGRISKAIKLKLQELRIDDIFKEGILKYKGLLSNDDSNDNELEKKILDNSDLNIEDNVEDNVGLEDKDNKNDVEEKKQQIEEDYESNSIKNEEQDIEVSNQENISNGSMVEENNSDCNSVNETMMQYFEWYYPYDGSLWNKVKENSKELSDAGITALWLPPACKGTGGIYDAGDGL